jgi:hypothetical protein
VAAQEENLTMKTLLLLLVALAISAQTLDKYSSPPIPSEYLTMIEDEGHLNGYWWQNATATERQIYLLAWQDATGNKVPASSVFYGRPFHLDLSSPVVDVIHRLGPRTLRCEN